MLGKSKIIWSLKELTIALRERQLKEFDVNIGVSGKRGLGKSTFIFKLFNSFKHQGFKQDKHQVYSRKDVIHLLQNQQFSFCWDDEAINSGYKRDFQQKAQNDLIKIITNYRDNYNIYASALPFFYTLDKALRSLIFMHIHIIERGFAVILLPLGSQIHSEDPWDTKINIKIEEKENKRIEKNPKLKFRFHKLTTFAGYLYFGDMTEKQKKKYKGVKQRKRSLVFKDESVPIIKTFSQKAYTVLVAGKLTKDGLIQMCQFESKKYSSVVSELNKMLKDDGEEKTVGDLFKEAYKLKNYNLVNNNKLSSLVPDV